MERFRQLFGVDPGKLKAFKNLNQKAIQPAVAEVNFLSDFGCSVEPVTRRPQGGQGPALLVEEKPR